ncbi:MAG: Uma2 family endonuclease [Gammaproteobacteria bacterium]
MSTQRQPKLSPEDYLALERSSEQRHSYFRGEMFAIGGASPRHNRIVMNTSALLWQQFRKRPCQVYTSDMRVKVNASGLYTYPDIVAICGEERYDDQRQDTLINPLLIIEVLSESTEAYDRGDKFGHYQKLESLQEYILVSQSNPKIECFTRQTDNTWLYVSIMGLDAILRLATIECELRLTEVYERVEF